MQAVVQSGGTGKNIQVPGYNLAAKTGTAQRVNPKTGGYEGGGYTASFAGFAPAEDPAVVVAVAIQGPRQGRYGGLLAGPVFQETMSFALGKLGVAPSAVVAPDVPITGGFESRRPTNADRGVPL